MAAFQTTGVDLAGPVSIKGGQKAWIVLFTCGMYRGIRLDVVNSLRTNLVGAKNLLDELDWNVVLEKSEVKRIRWILNCASAPWQGGWFERLIRTTKDLLRKMIGKAKLTYDEMRTCLSGVEQVVNDRPLTAVTQDAEDLRPLTPSMFLRDLPLSFPEGEEITGALLSEGYEKMQQLKVSLQARFRKEYLGFLSSRNLGPGSKLPPVGSLVLVGDTNKKRFQWPLGRILEYIKGKDGIPRNCKIKVSTGILTRPVQRIHPLELYGEDVKVEEVKSVQEQSKTGSVSEAEQFDSEENAVVPDEAPRTKSGRAVKVPIRYGQWNY